MGRKKTKDKNEKKELKVLAKIEITTDTEIITGKERYFHVLLNKKDSGFDYDKKKRILIDRETNEKRKPWQDSRGYEYFNIRVNTVWKKIPLHRLIAALFIPIPPELAKEGYTQLHLLPNHLDGDKSNTVESNLEWTTTRGNSIHALETGLLHNSVGENSHLSKITEEQAIQICELIMQKKSFKEIAEEIGCSKKTVIHIKAGECWKHITKNYDFPKLDNKPYTVDEKIIHKICKALEKKKFKDPEIAKKYGISREYVRDVRLHRLRKDISCNYNF